MNFYSKSVDIPAGGALWTESIGESGSSSPILLISGAGAHAHFWSDSFCSYLAEKNHLVIRYDHRDIGLSFASSEDYLIDVLVQDALEILYAYGIASVHLIGHSMGGYMGQLLAGQYPEKVRTLTTISAGPLGETPQISLPYSNEEKQLLYETWRIMLRNRPSQEFEESFNGFLDVWTRLSGKIPVDEAMAREYTRELYTRSNYPVGVHARHVKVMQKVVEDMGANKAIFEKIQTPVLVIQGQEDYLVLPERGGRALTKVLPKAQLALIPKMGHLFFNQEMERKIADLILPFLSQYESK